MDIIGLRAKVPGAIIVDGGSGYCKFGWSKYQCPSGRSATFMDFGNIEAPMYSRHHQFYNTVYGRMQVKSTSQPIVVSIPVCHNDSSRKQLKGAIYSALFDMNVPAVCAINQATLALYAARRTSGIVVNIGFNQTSVVPSNNGVIINLCTRKGSLKSFKEVTYLNTAWNTSYWDLLAHRFRKRRVHLGHISSTIVPETLVPEALDAHYFFSRELRELLPLSLSDGIKVIPPPYGVDSAWHGARLISNIVFKALWGLGL
ncbi:actin-related protein 8-like [Chenopodium quinoa]|uniref:actin-related protein 8-like n=1 Tax=Chenopodium quinoa TaxID=63459 RepID=UPI000B7734B4|nr:actin-related protein 8-like [Chenopodium quinoa]